MSVYETESSRKCLPDLIDAFSHVHVGLDYHIYDNLIKRLHLCTLKGRGVVVTDGDDGDGGKGGGLRGGGGRG